MKKLFIVAAIAEDIVEKVEGLFTREEQREEQAKDEPMANE